MTEVKKVGRERERVSVWKAKKEEEREEKERMDRGDGVPLYCEGN